MLPDGRIVISLDPGGHGNFELWVLSADGTQRERLFGEPGRLELDPAIVTATRAPATLPAARAIADSTTFRYADRDVFAGAGAPARRPGAHLHVYQLVSPDSVREIHDVPVPKSGRVDVLVPAAMPLFEQLTDTNGRALMSAHGPAQVRGFNSGAAGATAKCVGCHLGHSAAQ